MNYLSIKVQKIFTLGSVICLAFPIIFLALWSHAVKLGDNQLERKAIFDSFFPDLLHGRYSITYLGILFCILSITLIVLSNLNHGLPGPKWKILHIVLMITSLLLLFLNIFSLL